VKEIRLVLIVALVLISLGGMALHARIHPLINTTTGEFEPEYLPAAIIGLVSIILVPLLFLKKRTAAWGYLLNGMAVILGTIFMAHFSLSTINFNQPLFKLILSSTLADILILWGKFMVGKAVYDSYMMKLD